MTELPQSIKVGYTDYQLALWSALDATAAQRKAECCSLTNTIRIRQDLSPADFAESLIHEILHAIYYVWDIRDEDKEEKTVSVMSSGLATVWRDNPALIAFLSSRLA